MKFIYKAKIVLSIAAFLFGGFFAVPSFAQQDELIQEVPAEELVVEQTKARIDVFVRDTCKHCKEEKEFLNNLSQQRDDFEVVYHNLKNEATYEQWKNFAEDNNYSKITPITIVGEQVILGFDVAETTGQALIKLIDAHDGSVEPPSFDDILAGTVKVKTAGESTTGCTEDSTECAGSDSLYIFNVPFIGVIDLYKYSIPSISFILGLIDGFNPCAMWVLVTFLLVLMQIGDKRRMLEIAGLFIIAEALMYYLILTVWFTAWDFIGLDAIITPIVGIIAIGGGIFFLYEWRTSDGTCQVTDMQQRAKISSRIKKIAETKFGWKTAIGIITLALSVNVIEFACSVGIPQAYTKIIEINQLGMLETHANMLIYILAYMIDDVIVFGIAFYGIDKLHLTTKYSRASNLIGGILMIILGAILIFARELLVF